jgi:hypothetical protein
MSQQDGKREDLGRDQEAASSLCFLTCIHHLWSLSPSQGAFTA